MALIDTPEQAREAQSELPKLQALIEQERAAKRDVVFLIHRQHALRDGLRAYIKALNTPPKLAENSANSERAKDHPRYAKDCTIENCAICASGRDRYSLDASYFE